MAPIQHRMPVLLDPTAWARWLIPQAGADDVAELLAPCPRDRLQVRPASRLVNDPGNEGPGLLEPGVIDHAEIVELSLPIVVDPAPR